MNLVRIFNNYRERLIICRDCRFPTVFCCLLYFGNAAVLSSQLKIPFLLPPSNSIVSRRWSLKRFISRSNLTNLLSLHVIYNLLLSYLPANKMCIHKLWKCISAHFPCWRSSPFIWLRLLLDLARCALPLSG